ncbi:hypothetical protein [Burkholderia metallica]|uniref:hypothetical protein n=1 Tax=Burkholderia metallica TaxID=488729 RepID=UPI001CF0EDB9|nr:hypothetical protein [Burkholderia metallica]MCA8018070.1 hypothetical protein [Burkholderia metallica]
MSFIGAAVGGVASAVGSAVAGGQQAAGTKSATNLQRTIYQNNQQMQQPFLTAGQGATTALARLLGVQEGNYGALPNGYLTQQQTPAFSFDPSSILNSPGYQFAQSQGMKQIQNSAAATTGALSGPALKELTNFATGTAEQYFKDYFNQALNQYTTNFNTQQTSQNNIFNRLSSLAGLGQNAAAQTGNTGAQIGNGIAQSTAATGAANAAGTVGIANGLSSAFGNAGAGYGLSSILGLNNSGASGLIGGQGALNIANASTDPIGSLNATQGWTGGGS